MRRRIPLLPASLLLLVLCALSAHALVIQQPLLVPSANSLTLSFSTDQATNVTVQYGVNALDHTYNDSAMSTTHQITLSGLQEQAQYSVKFTACSTSECQTSSLLSATTKEVPMSLSYRIRPSTATTFSGWTDNSTQTWYVNSNLVTLQIISKPLAQGYLRVDGSLKRAPVIPLAGNVTLGNIEVTNGSVIQLESVSGASSLNRTMTVYVDRVPPVATLRNISAYSTVNAVNITGSVSEKTDALVYDNGRLALSFYANTTSFDKNLPGLSEGQHNITVRFTDRAGNSVEKHLSTVVDTTQNTLTLFNVPNKVYTDTVVLHGTTKPYAYVFAFVNGKTGPKGSIPGSLIGVLQKIGELVDANSNYFTQADANGNFSMQITLSRGAQQLANAQYTGDASSQQIQALQEWQNDVKVVSIDHALRNATQDYHITISTCDSGGDWNFDVEQVSPNIINPFNLEQGTASVGINYKLDWQGAGTNEHVTSVSIGVPSDATTPSTAASLFGDSAKDENLIAGTIPQQYSDSLHLGTMSVNLQAYPGGRDAISHLSSVQFMLQAMIQYTYTGPSGTQMSGTQRKCLPVNIQVDKEVYLGDKIPSSLLKGASKLIDNIAHGVDTADRYAQTIEKVMLYASLGAKLGQVISGVSMRLTCSNALGIPLIGGAVTPKNPPGTAACDAEKGCEQCWQAVSAYESFSQKVTWLNDRFYCPTVPSFQNFAQQVQTNNEYTRQSYYYVGTGGTTGASGSGSNDGIIMKDQMLASCKANAGTENNNPDNLCKAYYLAQYQSACPFYYDMYQDSFSNGQKASWYNQFMDSLNFCSAANSNKKNGHLYSFDTQCTRIEGTTQEPVKPCVVITRDLPNGSTEVYWVKYVETVTDLNKAEKTSGQTDKTTADSKTLSQAYLTDQNLYKSVGTNTQSYYVQDRDVSAAELKLPQNAVIKSLVHAAPPVLIDPTSSIARSVQCACVSSTTAYLNEYEAALTAVNQCLQAAKVSKDLDAAKCNNIFSMYLCDFVYDAISCAPKAVGTIIDRASAARTDQKSTNSPTNFFDALKGAFSDVSSSVENRYGGTNMYQTMFQENGGLIHSACVGAFTGDFDASMSGMLDRATAQQNIPSDSLITQANRRFMSADPFTGMSKYVYTVGYGIVAGSDITYSVRLKCSNDQSCDPSDGYINGQCDCYGKTAPVYRPIASGYLQAGQVATSTFTQALQDPVRYDSVEITYTYHPNGVTGQTKQETDGPWKISEAGGPPPGFCKMDLTSGQFMCQIDAGSDSQLITFPQGQQPALSSNVYEIGDYIRLKGSFYKNNPQGQTTPVTLFASLTFNGQTKNQKPIVFTDDATIDMSSYAPASFQGVGIPGIPVTADMFSGAIASSQQINSVNTGKTVTGTSSVWTASVTPPIAADVSIVYGTWPAPINAQAIKISMGSNLQLIKLPSAVAAKVQAKDNAYYIPMALYTAHKPFVINVTDASDPNNHGTITLNGEPVMTTADGKQAASDSITVPALGTKDITGTLTLKFYKGDYSNNAAPDPNNLIKTLTFTPTLRNQQSQGAQCDSRTYNGRADRTPIATVFPQAGYCLCGTDPTTNQPQSCSTYCIDNAYCSTVPLCNIGAENTQPCFCGDATKVNGKITANVAAGTGTPRYCLQDAKGNYVTSTTPSLS